MLRFDMYLCYVGVLLGVLCRVLVFYVVYVTFSVFYSLENFNVFRFDLDILQTHFKLCNTFSCISFNQHYPIVFPPPSMEFEVDYLI